MREELHFGTPAYPEQLAATPDPPRTLYVCGDPGALLPGLAIVGARRATPYGVACASRFAGWAARSGVVVISGAAIGCDQAAQRAALEAGGVVVAVLGCGADVDYPRGAAQLLDAVRNRGAVVSEVPWGEEPRRWAFPLRNRIIAGLSSAVLVVEAGLPSGTFSTADAALEAGRDVLAVPGSIASPESRGSNRLIRQGATPITDVSELADALRDAGLYCPDPSAGEIAARAAPDDPVIRAVMAQPMRPDDLCGALDLDITVVARALARGESLGLVRRDRLGRYGPATPTPGLQ